MREIDIEILPAAKWDRNQYQRSQKLGHPQQSSRHGTHQLEAASPQKRRSHRRQLAGAHRWWSPPPSAPSRGRSEPKPIIRKPEKEKKKPKKIYPNYESDGQKRFFSKEEISTLREEEPMDAETEREKGFWVKQRRGGMRVKGESGLSGVKWRKAIL